MNDNSAEQSDINIITIRHVQALHVSSAVVRQRDMNVMKPERQREGIAVCRHSHWMTDISPYRIRPHTFCRVMQREQSICLINKLFKALKSTHITKNIQVTNIDIDNN